MTDKKVDNIQDLLEDIKAILVISNQDKIEEMKKNVLKKGSMEEMIYKLCDGTKTNSDIAKEIKKTEGFVRASASSLRKKGLIKTVEINNKKIHEQRF